MKVANFQRILLDIWIYRSTLIIVLTPILLAPLLFVNPNEQFYCLFGAAIIIIFWLTEVIPFPVTSLLPLVLFPILGILTAKKVAQDYLKDSLVLFIGGFFIAIAIERAHLHNRIALKALLVVGENPKWIVFGLMATTGFLSMWIINTAATAMMLPISEAILIEMIKSSRSHIPKSNVHNETEIELIGSKENTNSFEEKIELKRGSLNKYENNLCKLVLLCVCYSANIGGLGTMTGTQANIIVVGMLENKYGANVNVTYASWIGFGLPLVIIILFFAWILLLIYFLGFKTAFTCKKNSNNNEQIKVMIQEHYHSLGRMRFNEIIITVMLGLLILLWIFRSPKFVAGWNTLFEKGYVTDATAAMFVCFLLFVLPSDWPDFLCCSNRDSKKKPVIRESLLTWDTIQEKMPWGVILLAGGSFALADAVEVSGLSKTIGNILSNLGFLSSFGLCIIVAIIVTFVTEFTANAATATLLAPILSAVAEKLYINPLYLVLTSTICVSYAFMLPIATPPNAIVFGYGLLKIKDMVVVGFIMNCISVIVTVIAMNTWIWFMFDLGTYPDWAPVLYNTTIYNQTV